MSGKWLAAGTAVTLAAVASGFGTTAQARAKPAIRDVKWPAPRTLEGSILTGLGTPHAEYIIAIKKPTQSVAPTYEVARLTLLAQIRDDMRVRFNLRSRAGHVARTGYRLTCVARTRVGALTVYLSAWAAPSERYDSMKAFATLINPKRWTGGCAA